MAYVHEGVRGLSLIVQINADRLMFVATLVVALLAGAFIGSLLV